jgi:predicted ATPase
MKRTDAPTNLHLRSVALSRHLPLPEGFPFSVPIIRALETLDFTTPITLFAGDNGSGKSTLLEAIAIAANMITVGTSGAADDATWSGVRPLAARLKLTWTKRIRRGFFMRAEDFFGYARQQADSRAGMLADLAEIDREFAGRSELSKGLAKMGYARELHDMDRLYGQGLDAGSHGESFFTLFRSRFVPDGLYILDEPEAPLSPARQLAFLTMLQDAVIRGGQFLIATHSPILLAYPGATIWSCDDGAIHTVTYEELEQISLLRDFLAHREAYLRRLFGE